MIVGTATAPAPPPPPEPTTAVAAIPTSTPDLRPTPAPQTLTPTQRPSPTAIPSAVVVEVTNPPTAPVAIATPRPTPTPEPRGRAVVFFAAPGKAPAAVSIIGTSSGSESDRVFFRLLNLRDKRTGGPEGYVNVVPGMKARLAEVTVDVPHVATVGFFVPEGDWGIPSDQVPLLVQQLVFTVTEEPTIDWIRLTQNGGTPAVIAGKTYDKPLARDEVR